MFIFILEAARSSHEHISLAIISTDDTHYTTTLPLIFFLGWTCSHILDNLLWCPAHQPQAAAKKMKPVPLMVPRGWLQKWVNAHCWNVQLYSRNTNGVLLGTKTALFLVDWWLLWVTNGCICHHLCCLCWELRHTDGHLYWNCTETHGWMDPSIHRAGTQKLVELIVTADLHTLWQHHDPSSIHCVHHRPLYSLPPTWKFKF